MDNKALLDCVEQLLVKHGGAHHVDDLAVYAADAHPVLNQEMGGLPVRLSQCLSYDVKKSDSRFTRQSNGSGGNKRGIYKLKRRRATRAPLPVSIAPSVSTQYTGRAGEHAVISELLFWGFNASLMAVDDGIDIVASKQNKYFHIQVKTANESGSNGVGQFAFQIKRAKFEEKHASDTFYILVVRRLRKSGYRTDFLIFPSNEIARLRDIGVINDKDALSLRVVDEKEGFLLNGKENVNRCANAFSAIA